MKNYIFRKIILSILLMVGFSSIGLAANNNDFKKLIEQRAESLVTVKFILSVSMGGAANMEQESENEMSCVMVSADGLVICSSNKLSGFMEMLSKISGGQQKMSAIPKDLKVIVGSDARTFEAEIVTKDSELDLVWIKVKNNEGLKFAFVDFSAVSDKEVGLGDELIVLRRMGNYFGREVVVNTGRLSGIASKPRKLYVPDPRFNDGGGLPVFARNGDVIGFMVTQLPDSDDSSGSLMSMISGNIQDAMSGLILPAKDVSRATDMAMTPVAK